MPDKQPTPRQHTHGMRSPTGILVIIRAISHSKAQAKEACLATSELLALHGYGSLTHPKAMPGTGGDVRGERPAERSTSDRSSEQS